MAILQDIANQLNRISGKLGVKPVSLPPLSTILAETMPPATKPSVANVEMVSANTEYSHMLPIGCKKFLLHSSDGTAFRLSYKRGKVADSTRPYFTQKANTAYSEDNLDIKEDTYLYFACASASKVIEIIQWS